MSHPYRQKAHDASQSASADSSTRPSQLSAMDSSFPPQSESAMDSSFPPQSESAMDSTGSSAIDPAPLLAPLPAPLLETSLAPLLAPRLAPLLNSNQVPLPLRSASSYNDYASALASPVNSQFVATSQSASGQRGDRYNSHYRFNLSPLLSPTRPLLTPPPIFAHQNLSRLQNRQSLPVASDACPLASLLVNNLVLLQPLPGQYSRHSTHSRSVSLASSFLLDRSSDASSIVDFSQNVLQLYLGNNLSSLVPRIKTIELYRQNAKKSNDPAVLFQYAQYMLQTALLLDTSDESAPTTPDPNKKGASTKKGNRKSKLDFEKAVENPDSIDDEQLRAALLKEASIYLKRLADKGYVDAQYLLGDSYSLGALKGHTDPRESFVLFQAAAKHGHTELAYRTSYCYEEGLGTGRDARKALDFLKMAASKNHPAAMYKLGIYMFYGKMGLGSDMNVRRLGIKWLERALNVATELTAAAPYELGKLYFEGFSDIVIPDKRYALELYSQAAALGHTQLQALLGKFYEVGEVLPMDSNLLIHYYTQAALLGDPHLMLAMCAWYLVGSEPFLPKDNDEAFEWARRAAQCNLDKAQFAVASFYDKGIGCSPSEADAQQWYVRAAENGNEQALSRIKDQQLAQQLTKKMKRKLKAAAKNPADTSAGATMPLSKVETDKDCVIM